MLLEYRTSWLLVFLTAILISLPVREIGPLKLKLTIEVKQHFSSSTILFMISAQYCSRNDM